ncbi:MAG: peptidoglycan DD-metalloendopeptidase family protein [Candidatus Peregrinibacteria bacterium]
MGAKLDKYLITVVAAAFLLAHTAVGFVSDFEGGEASAGSVVQADSGEASAEPEMSVTDFGDIKQKQDDLLKRLKSELNLSKTGYKQILMSANDTQERLDLVREEKLSLSEYLENLDSLISSTQEKLVDVVKQLVEAENEITLLYEQIDLKQIALNYQKELLKDYSRIIYEQDNNLLSFDENGEINAFKLLLADGSVGENLKDLDYLGMLDEAGQQMVEKLQNLSADLQNSQKELNKKKNNLLKLQNELENEKKQLELQKDSKENLMRLTFGQESIYQQLLEQTTEEQKQMLSDVKHLSEAIAFVEQKIAEEGDNFNPDEYLSLLDPSSKAMYNFQLNLGSLNSDGFLWPVDPDRGLSAYFHDPTYYSAFGMQHNAIDIPEYQGSALRAAADGVVFTTKDNGFGYSYIILAHATGFMSVYGHVSEILVSEGEVVNQGSVIGLSGGMPGTKGAGYMTTGPHLHFEMLLNGLYVDPLDYLPIQTLTEDQISALPEKYFDSWADATAKSEIKSVSRF